MILVCDFVLLVDGKIFWLEEEYVFIDWVNGIGDIFLVIIVVELVKGYLVEVGVCLVKKVVYEVIVNEIEVGYQFGLINYWVG